MNNKILFQEKQKFTQWWLWLLLLIIACIPVYFIWSQFVQGEPVGSKPMSNIELVIFVVLIFMLPLLFWFMALKTSIDKKGIQMQFAPFYKKHVDWNEVKSANVINYGFVGGWGIRLGTTYGTVYNIKGNMGLAIELINGKKFLIGTQKPEELDNVVTTILK